MKYNDLTKEQKEYLRKKLLDTNNIADFLKVLDRNCFETRAAWRSFTKDPIYQPRFDISTHDDKEL